MNTSRKPTEEQIEAIGRLDTIDLEQTAKLMRLGQDATKELVDTGELPALICNQKHAVLLRTDVLAYIAEEGRRQAQERRNRALSMAMPAPAAKPAEKKSVASRSQALPDLGRYEVTTSDQQGSKPAGSRSGATA